MNTVIASSVAGVVFSVFGGPWSIVWLLTTGLWIMGWRGMFIKAGRTGWLAFIPIYNIFVLLRIVGKPHWWFVLYIVPIVNIWTTLVIAIDLAKSYGKTWEYGVLWLWLFNFIGYMMLAYDDATYRGHARHL